VTAGGATAAGARGGEVFAEAGVTWNGVSPRLALARRLVLLAVTVVATGLLVGLSRLLHGTGRTVVTALAVAVLAVAAWSWWAVGRNSASRGWAEREHDLLVRRGFLFRSLTVVPYGRLQVVEVVAGPLATAFGFAAVTLVTASAHTDARIPGVHAAEARSLRDRLTDRGETEAAGL